MDVLDRFVVEHVQRAKLVNAPYNPRRITNKARQKLTAGMEKHGLLQPLIWNKRTGNIVSGHQRIAILDDIKGTKDYSIPCAVIDMDEKQEKEANILLNNDSAGGDWDVGALESILKENLDIEATGFDSGDLYDLFEEDIFTEEEDLESAKPAAKVARDKPHARRVKAPSVYTDEPPEDGGALPPRAFDPWKQFIETKAGTRPDVGYFYLVLVFESEKHKLEQLNELGLPDDVFQPAEPFIEAYRRSPDPNISASRDQAPDSIGGERTSDTDEEVEPNP